MDEISEILIKKSSSWNIYCEYVKLVHEIAPSPYYAYKEIKCFMEITTLATQIHELHQDKIEKELILLEAKLKKYQILTDSFEKEMLTKEMQRCTIRLKTHLEDVLSHQLIQ